MRNLFKNLISGLLIFSVVAFSLTSLSSCGEKAAPYELMLEFCASYGIEDTVFSPCVKEGDEGYTDSDFFESVFGKGDESVCDYAVVFLSDLNRAGECSLFLCYSDYDALMVCDMLYRRIDLIKSMGAGIDTSYLSDAVVFKSGKYAVMCALSDNERAEKIWRKIL